MNTQALVAPSLLYKPEPEPERRVWYVALYWTHQGEAPRAKVFGRFDQAVAFLNAERYPLGVTSYVEGTEPEATLDAPPIDLHPVH